jgi:hypothetical protein
MLCNGAGVKGLGHPGLSVGSTDVLGRNRVDKPKSKGNKPFVISKWEVWEAYQKVKAKQGAAGVDKVSLAGTLVPVALVAQGIEQRFPNPSIRSWSCAADLQPSCVWCPSSAARVLHVCSVAGNLSTKIQDSSITVDV